MFVPIYEHQIDTQRKTIQRLHSRIDLIGNQNDVQELSRFVNTFTICRISGTVPTSHTFNTYLLLQDA